MQFQSWACKFRFTEILNSSLNVYSQIFYIFPQRQYQQWCHHWAIWWLRPFWLKYTYLQSGHFLTFTLCPKVLHLVFLSHVNVWLLSEQNCTDSADCMYMRQFTYRVPKKGAISQICLGPPRIILRFSPFIFGTLYMYSFIYFSLVGKVYKWSK